MLKHKVKYDKKKDFDRAESGSKENRGRNIIVLMDGTWNDETGKDGDGVVTNVVKLYRCFGLDTKTQLTRYFRGVGNDDDYGLLYKTLGGFAGRKEKSIRDDAYSTIVKEYLTGDKIFIFGFSRGAASARMLATQINREGIPEEITITSESQSNKATRNIENRFVEYKASDKKLIKSPPVEFLGVWDTVDAFGIPFELKLLRLNFERKNLFKNKTVAPNIVRVVHLVSIDETRNPFVPTLMNAEDRIEEVWCPGVHSDVGGGYLEDELGRTTLSLMMDYLNRHVKQAAGIREISYDKQVVKLMTEPQSNAVHFHFHGLKWQKFGVGKSVRAIKVIKEDPEDSGKSVDTDAPPKIHESLFDLRRSGFTYSIVPQKRWFRSKPAKKFRVQYNPPFFRRLAKNYTIKPPIEQLGETKCE